jgi:predicted peptidase
MKRAEGNFLMATNMRTSYANRLFKPATIATAIDEAAMQGHRVYRVVQEFPFDLSETKAAEALEIWLDDQQFHYVWRPTFIEQDPCRPNLVTEYPELEISW